MSYFQNSYGEQEYHSWKLYHRGLRGQQRMWGGDYHSHQCTSVWFCPQNSHVSFLCDTDKTPEHFPHWSHKLRSCKLIFQVVIDYHFSLTHTSSKDCRVDQKPFDRTHSFLRARVQSVTSSAPNLIFLFCFHPDPTQTAHTGTLNSSHIKILPFPSHISAFLYVFLCAQNILSSLFHLGNVCAPQDKHR